MKQINPKALSKSLAALEKIHTRKTLALFFQHFYRFSLYDKMMELERMVKMQTRDVSSRESSQRLEPQKITLGRDNSQSVFTGRNLNVF